MDELLGKLKDKLDLLETLEPSSIQQSSTARRMYEECKSAQASLFKYGHHKTGSVASKQQADDLKSRIGGLVERVEGSDLLGSSGGVVKLASTSSLNLIDVGETQSEEMPDSLFDSHLSETPSYGRQKHNVFRPTVDESGGDCRCYHRSTSSFDTRRKPFRRQDYPGCPQKQRCKGILVDRNNRAGKNGRPSASTWARSRASQHRVRAPCRKTPIHRQFFTLTPNQNKDGGWHVNKSTPL